MMLYVRSMIDSTLAGTTPRTTGWSPSRKRFANFAVMEVRVERPKRSIISGVREKRRHKRSDFRTKDAQLADYMNAGQIRENVIRREACSENAQR
jgi:hypothetical protein